MKRKMIVCALLCVTGLFIGCNDNDQWLPGNIPETGETKTYTNKLSAPIGANTLALTYSGLDLIGKDVSFTMDGNGSATITLNSVLPGGGEASFTGVNLLPVKGGYVFNGSATAKTGTTFKYSGKIVEKHLLLNLTDVQLPANPLMASPVLSLVNIAQATTDSTKKEDIPGSSVLKKTITWELQHAPSRLEINIQNPLLSLLMPMLDKGLGKVLNTMLQGVSFHPDGNLTAEYAPMPDTINLMQYMMSDQYNVLQRPQSDWQTSPLNLITYNLTDDTTMYITPNVDMIIRQIGNDQAKTKSGIMDNWMTIEKVYKLINRWSTDGIKLFVKQIEPDKYTVTASSKYRETLTRYEGNFYLVLPPEETTALFELIDVLPEILPQSILDQSIGDIPILGNMTIGQILTMLEGVDKFQLGLYLNK